MKAVINRQLLEQINFDSSAPSGSASVIHRFNDAAEYAVQFFHEKAPVAIVALNVTPEAPGKGLTPEQITVDLTEILTPTRLRETASHRDPFLVRPKGYVSFTSSVRTKPFSILAEPKVGKGAIFDSRQLGPDDIFAVTLLRPGDYSLVNELDGCHGYITMAYPEVGDRPYRPPPPVVVESYAKGFQPDRVRLQPAQGLIFRIQTAARIKIALVKPDDGPKDRARKGFGISREMTLKAIERLRELRKNQKS